MAEAQKQSRVGKRPVEVPQGVTINLTDTMLSVKGPKGELDRRLPPDVLVEHANNTITVKIAEGAAPRASRFQGLTRALVANMVKGVTDGYKKSLDLYGVGYRADLKGQDLTLALGLSHTVEFTLPDAVKAKVETIDDGGNKRPRLHLESYSNEILGQCAAHIRTFRPPEPYNGKGIRYVGENIIKKAGKAGGKG